MKKQLNVLILFSITYFSQAQFDTATHWLLSGSANMGMVIFDYSSNQEQLNNTIEIQNQNSLIGGFQGVNFCAEKRMGKKQCVGVGLGWVQRKERINAAALKEMLTYYNRFQCIELTLEDRYIYSNSESNFQYLGLGLSGDFLISAKNYYRALGMNQLKIADINDGLKKNFATINLKWGMNWKLNKQWNVGCFMSAGCAITSMTENQDWKAKPWSLGVGIQISKWK